jgi:UDPglucose--hexose-1-phosphate uridylyltransferase
VLVFENRGEDVGATLSHPHGQIYALGHLPPFVGARVAALDDHRTLAGTCLSCEVVAADLASRDRTIVTNPSFTVAVPFAPDWPLEIHVRAKRHGARRLTDLTADERRDLAHALRAVVHRYDALYETPLAYLMVCQQAPDRVDDHRPVEDWHLSFEFLPPNRGPHKLKVRASVETAAGFFINDTLPEASASLLAGVPDGTDGGTDARRAGRGGASRPPHPPRDDVSLTTRALHGAGRERGEHATHPLDRGARGVGGRGDRLR